MKSHKLKGINFNSYTVKELEDMRITKKELTEKMGIEEFTFDYALNQVWLDQFVNETRLSYDLVISTTVTLYSQDNDIFGVPVSGCTLVQEKLEKRFSIYYEEV